MRRVFLLENRLFKMKRKMLLSLPLILAAGAVCTGFMYNNKPTYITKAESRVDSYLSNSYGPGQCGIAQAEKGHWDMECQRHGGQLVFKYAVYPADKAPYAIATDYYLVAANDEAKKSATVGLMRYLKIDTGTQKG